jgi:hypothetical protein
MSGCPAWTGSTRWPPSQRRVDAEVIVISGHGNVESAVRPSDGRLDFVESRRWTRRRWGAQRAAPAQPQVENRPCVPPPIAGW